TSSDRAERQELAAAGPDLYLGVHAGADAAVEAGGPPAVVLLHAGQGGLPVLPQPVLVQTGVEMVPGQLLGVGPLPGWVPVQVHAEGGQLRRGRVAPPLGGEVLPPPVDPGTLLPLPPDHRAAPPVAAGQQALDQR